MCSQRENVPLTGESVSLVSACFGARSVVSLNGRMLQDTIAKLEERLRQTTATDEAKREELLGLLAKLKAEVAELSETHADQAQSIAGFTAVSAHEATREDKNPQLMQLSLKGLASSVEEFKASHPRLVEVVNRICTTLSNLGI
jgi:hypothetical protein